MADRYRVLYRDGYYVVIDSLTSDVVPPDPGHYKKHKDGYLWPNAAGLEAARLNDEVGLVDLVIAEIQIDRALRRPDRRLALHS